MDSTPVKTWHWVNPERGSATSLINEPVNISIPVPQRVPEKSPHVSPPPKQKANVKGRKGRVSFPRNDTEAIPILTRPTITRQTQSDTSAVVRRSILKQGHFSTLLPKGGEVPVSGTGKPKEKNQTQSPPKTLVPIRPIRKGSLHLSKFALPPFNLEQGAVRDDDYAIDWRGNFVDVPTKFYKTTVRQERCPNDDLNEIFAEKFCLNNWTDYFGRSLLATCYLYLVLSVIMVVIAWCLYITPSEAQLLARLGMPRRMKGPRVMLFCGGFNLFLALITYFSILQNYRRFIPYILHGMLLTSILLLAVACWTPREWVTPSRNDYLSVFVASAMNDLDPDFFTSVWPSLDRETFSQIQKTFACCGFQSPEDWFTLNGFRPGTRRMDATCCVNTTGNRVPTRCANFMEAWLRNPSDMVEFEKMKGLISKKNCEGMLAQANEYYTWDLQLYPVILFVLHFGIVVGMSYLLFRYIREVNTWDGEVRMKLFRDNHKNYLRFLGKWVVFQVTECLCSVCCKSESKVHPGRKPLRFVTGPMTHFEVWHTANGEIINVVEVNSAGEMKFGDGTAGLGNTYMDLNDVTVTSSNDSVVERERDGRESKEGGKSLPV